MVNIFSWIPSNMWSLTIIFLIMHIMQCSLFHWVDYEQGPQREIDTDFDRLVYIVYNVSNNDPTQYNQNNTNLAPGVLFYKNQILTSFNPFRKLIKDTKAKFDVVIEMLQSRYVINDTVLYRTLPAHIVCARQVIPVDDDEDIIVWHGNKENSPLHDLMVIRIDKPVEFVPVSKFSTKHNVTEAGPVLTKIASRQDRFKGPFKFASLGYKNDFHMWKYCCLHSKVYNEFDNAIANCDEWLPREWGYFICIKNNDDFTGVGSGAMLFHADKLYGVGSFLLKRGSESVLVFTDVRYYYNYIYLTCTEYDQALVTPPDEPETTEVPLSS